MKAHSLFGEKKGFFMHIPIEIHKSIKSIAATKGISMSRLINKILINYIKIECDKQQRSENRN